MGGQIAAWPNAAAIMGWQLSAGERLTGTGIPEMTFHIEQEAVVANTRKMRALWTLEASQDLKAYHNLDLERELTDLLSKELQLEIDRELIEDLRMIAYGFRQSQKLGGVDQNLMDNDYISMGGSVASPVLMEEPLRALSFPLSSPTTSTDCWVLVTEFAGTTLVALTSLLLISRKAR